MLDINNSSVSDSISNMNLEKRVDQLTEILTDLVPAVDALVSSQRRTDEHIKETNEHIRKTDEHIRKTDEFIQKTDRSIRLLVKSQLRTNLAIGELRHSNIRMADAIEKLAKKIDKVDEFEVRLKKIEDKVFSE